MIKIDGVTFSIPVIEVVETGDFLDKYAERTENGVLNRQLIGVYYNFSISFGSSSSRSDYFALWSKLTEPVEFHTVTAWDADGEYTFTAYFSEVTHRLRKLTSNGKPVWSGLTAKFIAREPARRP